MTCSIKIKKNLIFLFLRHVDPFVRMLHICLVASGGNELVTSRLRSSPLFLYTTHVDNFHEETKFIGDKINNFELIEYHSTCRQIDATIMLLLLCYCFDSCTIMFIVNRMTSGHILCCLKIW